MLCIRILLIHCYLVTPYADIDLGSGNGTKPLPEPMLTYHQRWSVVFTCEFHKNKIHNLNPQHMFGDYAFISLAHFPGANELTGIIVNHGANTVCNKAQSLKRSYFYSMIMFIHVRTLICFLLCNTFNQYRCEGLFPNYMFDSKHRHHH